MATFENMFCSCCPQCLQGEKIKIQMKNITKCQSAKTTYACMRVENTNFTKKVLLKINKPKWKSDSHWCLTELCVFI